LFAIFRAREFAWLQHKNGVIDDIQWNTEVAVVQFSIDARRIRDWWTSVGRAAFGGEFADFIDSLIHANPPTDSTFREIVAIR
jgi:hypothetical protein